MTPVMQQVLHDPDNGQYGDCQRACVASLLDLSPEAVPHFYESGTEEAFAESFNNFLVKNGLMEIRITPHDLSDQPKCYHMIYGETERETWHAVVACNGEIVHDPHPSGACLLESGRDNWIYAFLAKTCSSSPL